MLKVSLFVFIVFTSSLFSANQEDYLLCIHGFMGAAWNLHFIEKKLQQNGWDVINWQYPSRENFIAEHGENLVKDLVVLAQKKPGQPIHFVAHSMGALVLLAAMNHQECPYEAKIGKIVLIAPPVQGAYWARYLAQFSLVKLIAKDFSGHELMNKRDFDDLGRYPDSLEEILVIAGSFGFNPFIEGKNDGTVAVHETWISCPHKRIVIRRGHKTIIFSRTVAHLVSQFFKK